LVAHDELAPLNMNAWRLIRHRHVLRLPNGYSATGRD
jgi:hypothetical protein